MPDPRQSRAGEPVPAAVRGRSDRDGAGRPGDTAQPDPRHRSVLGVAALALLVAAVVSVVAAAVATTPDAADGLPDAREVAAARAAAEAAIVPVLSYDYRQLEQDKQAALSYLTPDFAVEYEQLFASVIAVNAPTTETVVNVEVLASGIVRTGEDLVDVLLFVNRPTTNMQDTDAGHLQGPGHPADA